MRYLPLLCGLVLAAAPFTSSTEKPAAKTIWLTDLAAGRSLARETGKPLFVVFRCER